MHGPTIAAFLAVSMALHSAPRLPVPHPDPAPSSPPAHRLPEQIADYESRTLAGFPLQINRALMEHDPALLETVLVMLESDLRMMQHSLPRPAFLRLQSTTIWIELQGAVVNPGMSGRGMCYHASRAWVTSAGLLPEKAGGVEICRAQDFMDWRRNQPFMTLHEFAHAWHHIIGVDNPEIRAAYEHARDAGLYDQVMHNMQTDPVRAYAMNNPTEYFAELTEAYFGLNDFEPFTRNQLAGMDPQGLAVVAKWWNKEVP
ncbi:MAG: hypothetical protein KJZ65_00100 [Phycisphaerales bacterium]|nr:hypothetical protein [Phycisphaerales bacterium]